MNTVTRPDGTPVDFRDVKAWGVIDSYWMPYQEFQDLPEVFCQRNTEARLNRARKHLAVLLPEHCIVFVAKLTQDDELQGQRFRAGYRWRIDSNTRALNWSTAGSDVIPKDLFVIELSFAEIDRIQFSYNTFDSMDSVERNQEKLYGILQGPYKFTPTSPKIIKGQILSALNKACCFYFPDLYENLSPKIAVHRLAAVASRWDQLVAPSWTREKMRPTQFIDDYLEANQTWQGRKLYAN